DQPRRYQQAGERDHLPRLPGGQLRGNGGDLAARDRYIADAIDVVRGIDDVAALQEEIVRRAGHRSLSFIHAPMADWMAGEQASLRYRLTAITDGRVSAMSRRSAATLTMLSLFLVLQTASAEVDRLPQDAVGNVRASVAPYVQPADHPGRLSASDFSLR